MWQTKSPAQRAAWPRAEARHDEAMERRERRRRELTQQRALTLQGVERLTSVLVLPHPESEAADVRHLRPNAETEMTAMRVVMEYETAQGRQAKDVHEKNLGYDVTSLDVKSGQLRLIEVKGLAADTGTILLTPNERRVAEDRRDCYWLYVVTNCAGGPQLQEPIEDPARFPWHEVSKVQHYWLQVDAMTKPMGDPGEAGGVWRNGSTGRSRAMSDQSQALAARLEPLRPLLERVATIDFEAHRLFACCLTSSFVKAFEFAELTTKQDSDSARFLTSALRSNY